MSCPFSVQLTESLGKQQLPRPRTSSIARWLVPNAAEISTYERQEVQPTLRVLVVQVCNLRPRAAGRKPSLNPSHFVPQRGVAPSPQPSPWMERGQGAEKTESRPVSSTGRAIRGNDNHSFSAGACPPLCNRQKLLTNILRWDQVMTKLNQRRAIHRRTPLICVSH